MAAASSALAQHLAQQTSDDVVQALTLYDSLCPDWRKGIYDILHQEPLKRYAGQILNFSWQKAFGFIKSDEATTDFGKDVFVSSNEIGHFQPGDQVTFTIVVNKNSQPQARLLQGSDGSIAAPQSGQAASHTQYAPPPAAVVPPAKRPRVDGPSTAQVGLPPLPPTVTPSWAPASDSWDRGPKPAARHAPREVPPPAHFTPSGPPQQAAVEAGQRFVGSITAFNPGSHFGFISSPAATQAFGKDVFLSDREIGSFQVHDSVSFEVVMNNRGQPQARNLRPPDMAEVEADMSSSSAALGDQAFVGTITSFYPEKHFGFIDCPEARDQFGKDVFLSDLEIGTYQVGESVSFRIVLNSRGHPQARDLGPANSGSALH